MKKKSLKSTKNVHVKEKVTNLKKVPENYKHLLEEDDIMYVVPGNCCCAPNCAADLLFHDEKYGTQLRIRIN